MQEKVSPFKDTGNWNSAPQYADLKIMRQLFLIDEYYTIAKFGFSSLLDELTIQDFNKEMLKIKGIKRLISSLLLLISNVYFALPKKETQHRELLDKFEKELMDMEDHINDLVISVTQIQLKKRILKINEKKFKEFLRKLYFIKKEINDPLNNANLIFFTKKKREFDADKIKSMLFKSATELG